MTIHKKLSRMSEAHEIARAKMEKFMVEFFPVTKSKDYRLSIATYSNISGEYAFSFWMQTHFGEVNEVIRVKEGELK
jgi:hypothetical protein